MAVFIRAPVVERVADGVTVHARYDGAPVAVSDGPLMGVAFHPELTDDLRFHQWLVDQALRYAARSDVRTKEGVGVGAQ